MCVTCCFICVSSCHKVTQSQYVCLFLSDAINTLQHSTKEMQTMPCYSGSIKPPFSCTELIKQALQEKRELTALEIYEWIS
jgi:hypothetical protein